VNDTQIKVELGEMQSHTMPRSMLTGIESKMAVPALFGLGGGVNLTFHGQGTTVIEAGYVKTKDANAIKKLLGY